MNYEIKTIGFNYTDLDHVYNFTPFTTRSVISIIPQKSGIMKFMLIQNKNIIKISIHNQIQKINIIDKFYNCEVNCKIGEIIKIVPYIQSKSKCEIIIKNLTINGDIPADIPADIPVEIPTDITTSVSNISTENEIITNILTEVTNNTTCNIPNQIVNLDNNKNFIIVTTRWGIKIAESLQNMLEELGYKTSIIRDSISDEMLSNNKTRPNEYFIILFSHIVPKMPEPNKYIIYQLEQKRQSKFITQSVLNNISNSLITWDYSNENIAQFDELYKNKIVFQPISIINKIQDMKLPIKYDILFFGANCIRRNKILKFIKIRKYNIFITNKIYGEEMYKIISQSRIILNLHVYEDAILEVARLNEVLSFNKLIISEVPCNADHINQNFYQDKVIFCEVINRNLSNIKSLVKLIDYYLKPDNYDAFISGNKNNINKIYLNSINYLTANLKIINQMQCTIQQVENNIVENNIVENNIVENNIVENNIVENTHGLSDGIEEYKIYTPKSQVYEYAKNTDTIFGRRINYIVNYVLKNKNHFDVDTYFYSQINNLPNMDESSLFKHIKEHGIESGLIYHPKQLKNIFTDNEIFTNSDNKIFIKKDNEYIEANKYVDEELYKKDFEWYMNQVEQIENKLVDCELLLLVFIGNLEIGLQLINKIKLYKNIEGFSLGICFRNRELFLNMNDEIRVNFSNYSIFISKEFGNDIIPTILMYNKIKAIINFSKIIKLHTKSSDTTWFNEMSDFLLSTKINNLNQYSIPGCNCICLQKYYHSDSNSLINIKILDKYRNNIDKNIFVRGSMFFCDIRVFISIFEIIKLDYKMFLNQNLYDTNNINYTNSPVHTLERLFGIIKI
jgi:hypothetical protein